MAKTKIKNNIPLVVRKIDKDLLEIQKTIGSSTADVVNFAMLDIQKKGFVDGRGATIKPKNHNKFKIFGQIAGGNRASKIRPGVMAYNKNKVVERGGNIARAFAQISFHISNRFSKTLAKGTNGVANVEIKRLGTKDNPKGQVANIRWEGKLGDFIGYLHFGNANGQQTIPIKNSKGKIRNAKIGQRAIAFNGIKRAMRRWNKYVEYNLTGTIKKRNKAKK
jgi:hypothetical protein